MVKTFRITLVYPSQGKFDPPMVWKRDIDAESRTDAERKALANEPSGVKIKDSFMLE